MENALKEMDNYELIDTLKASAKDIDFADTFNEAYGEVVRRAKENNDLDVLLKAQNLRWQQTEFLTQQWIEHYPKPCTTHSLRDAN